MLYIYYYVFFLYFFLGSFIHSCLQTHAHKQTNRDFGFYSTQKKIPINIKVRTTHTMVFAIKRIYRSMSKQRNDGLATASHNKACCDSDMGGGGVLFGERSAVGCGSREYKYAM